MKGALLLGFTDGLVIALLGFGVVLVYRGDRFVNLANAQLGVVPALLLGKLVLDTGLSWYIAFPLAVGFGAAIGAACRRYVIARLEDASRTSLMITTLGVSQLLLSLVFVDWFRPDSAALREHGYPFPVDGLWDFDHAVVTGRHVFILVAVPVLLVGLTVWLRASGFGRSMRAAASNPNAARLAGVDVRSTAVVTWAIAGGISTVGAVLTAPSRSVILLESESPLWLFLALGAAALAGFGSLPGVVVAGVALGLADGAAAYLGGGAGPGIVTVFVIVVVGLLVRSFFAATPLAVHAERGEDPFRIPDSIAGRWFVRSWAAPVIAVAVGAAMPFLPWLSAPHRTFVLAEFAVYGVAIMSLVVLTGWAGQVSLGQFALVGVGALTAARLAAHGWSLVATILAATIVGAIAAVIIGLPSARSRGLSLAVTSLGLAVIAPSWLFAQQWISPREVTSVEPAYAWGLGRIATQRSVYLVALSVLALVGVGLVRLRRSNVGRSLVAVRDNERGAAVLGFSPVAVRLAAFAASGAIGAVAGVLWLAVHRSVTPQSFESGTSLLLVSAAVIGGVHYVRGAVIGSLALFGLPLLFDEQIKALLGDSYPLQLFLGGLGVVIAQIANPGGIASARRRWLQGRVDWIAGRARGESKIAQHAAPPTIDVGPREPPAAPTTPALVARDVGVHFGGVHAVDTVTIEVAHGEIVGIIGANGAGKTALLDAICGLVPATGRVAIDGRDMTTSSAARRARLGVGRGFQDAWLFPTLSVRETIELALSRHYPTGVVGAVFMPPWSRLTQQSLTGEADVIIDTFGLGEYADAPIDRLSTGVRHICEIAAQAGTRPHLLVLDEPTSGVAQRETEAFGPLIRRVATQFDCAVLIVEHDMRLLMSLADRIYCLDRGRIVAAGTPDAVRRDPAVIASYLGAPRRTRKRTRKVAEVS